MTAIIPVAVLNIEAGTEQPDGTYDFCRLRAAFAGLRRAPMVIGLNESKRWGQRGASPLQAAAEILSDELGCSYDVRLGYSARGPIGPALLFDSQQVVLRSWDGDFDDKRNLARLALRCDRSTQFDVLLDHWAFHDGGERLSRARLLAPYGDQPTPLLLAGDLNGTASHPLMPENHWDQVPVNKRDYRGIQHADGTWGPDTRAVDRLIGPWDTTTGKRAEGYRFHALAELAHQTGTPAAEAFRPTVNDGINPGGGLIVDWLLVNAAWRHGYCPGSYQVHIPAGSRKDWPSDHRLVTADLQL